MNKLTYPIKKAEVITVWYWDCGEGHRHTTEEIALNCLKKQNRPKAKRYDDTQRVKMALMLIDGASAAAVANAFGITAPKQAWEQVSNLMTRTYWHFRRNNSESQYEGLWHPTITDIRKDPAQFKQAVLAYCKEINISLD